MRINGECIEKVKVTTFAGVVTGASLYGPVKDYTIGDPNSNVMATSKEWNLNGRCLAGIKASTNAFNSLSSIGFYGYDAFGLATEVESVGSIVGGILGALCCIFCCCCAFAMWKRSNTSAQEVAHSVEVTDVEKLAGPTPSVNTNAEPSQYAPSVPPQAAPQPQMYQTAAPQGMPYGGAPMMGGMMQQQAVTTTTTTTTTANQAMMGGMPMAQPMYGQQQPMMQQ